MRIEKIKPKEPVVQESIEILDYEKEIGCELVIEDRSLLPEAWGKKYIAHIEGLVIQYSSTAMGIYSSGGDTIDEAIIDLCKRISYRMGHIETSPIAIKEITIPKLVHTRLLNK